MLQWLGKTFFTYVTFIAHDLLIAELACDHDYEILNPISFPKHVYMMKLFVKCPREINANQIIKIPVTDTTVF